MTGKTATLDNEALEAIVAERVDAALTEERNKNAGILKKRVEMVEAKAKAQFDVLKEELISDTETFLLEASKGENKMANLDEIQRQINEMKRRDRGGVVEGRYGRMERARRMRRPPSDEAPMRGRGMRSYEGRRAEGRYASEGRYMNVSRRSRSESEERGPRYSRPSRFAESRVEQRPSRRFATRPSLRESALDRPLRRRPFMERDEQRPVRRPLSLRERLDRRSELQNEGRERRPILRDRKRPSATEGRQRPSLMDRVNRQKAVPVKVVKKIEAISPEKRKAFLMAGVKRYTHGFTEDIKNSVIAEVTGGKITSLVAMRKFISESVAKKTATPKVEAKADDKKPVTESVVTEGADFLPPVETPVEEYPAPEAW